MKKYAWALLALSALPGAAQKYTVSGSAPEGVKQVYLYHFENRAKDSVTVQNGQFRFAGEADGKIFGRVEAQPDYKVEVVLDGDVTVDLAKKEAVGTAENVGMSAWHKRFRTPSDKMDSLQLAYMAYGQAGKEIPEDVAKSIIAQYEAASEELTELIKQCCRENRDKKFPALYFMHLAGAMDKADVIALAEEGNPAYMDTELAGRIKPQLEGWKRQIPGVQFTDLEMNDVNGQPHKLSEYVGKGKYVLVDFWASWCGPCRREMPNVKRLYEAWKDKGFDIVGLSFDNDKAAWTGAIKQMDLPWHHLSDLKGWASVAGRTYGINAIPATLLIGPDGKVIAGGLSTEEVEAKLKELIK